MENETEIVEIKPKNMYFQICITQVICMVTILICIIIMKFCFKNSYIKFTKWCHNNLFEKTKITAQFDEETSSEI